MHKRLIFEDCKKKGFLFNLKEIDKFKIKSMIEIANTDFETAEFLDKSKRYNLSSTYKLYYDALHEITTALLILHKIKSYNHQCLFAYLCNKHKEFRIDIFERIRIKRNRLNYYGEKLTEREFYILKKTIKEYYCKVREKVLRNA
jgi:hypothetical protein